MLPVKRYTLIHTNKTRFLITIYNFNFIINATMALQILLYYTCIILLWKCERVFKFQTLLFSAPFLDVSTILIYSALGTVYNNARITIRVAYIRYKRLSGESVWKRTHWAANKVHHTHNLKRLWYMFLQLFHYTTTNVIDRW